MTWLVDGMNLIGSRPDGWWTDRDRAMREMAETLAAYAARRGEEVVLVFDRKPVDFRPSAGLEVVVAARAGRNAADHEIERIVADSRDPSRLRVVTSDKRLASRVKSMGATVMTTGAFRARLERSPSR